ncbi:hypothetical protein D3C72_2523680 [compost metagenome]
MELSAEAGGAFFEGFFNCVFIGNIQGQGYRFPAQVPDGLLHLGQPFPVPVCQQETGAVPCQ